MNGDIVTSDPAFLMFNAIFNNVIIVTIGFIVAVIMYKIVTSGATASDTIGKVKFAAIFLLVTGALYGV